MKVEKISEILRVISIFDALSQQQGSYRLGQITNWTTGSRATCDRQLRNMVKQGLLTEQEGKWKGRPCRLFSISYDGYELMHALKI